ncbi:MAG: hypothetical protein WCL21_06050 [Mariniphaga sp.]
MLLRILKSNTLFSPLLIPVIGILFWMRSFQTPMILDITAANGAMPLYNLIFNVLGHQAFWQVFVAFCLVLINSFFISQLGSSFIFLKRRSFLSGIIYLIIVSSVNDLHTFLPVHLATLLVLISLYFIFATYHKQVDITYTFNASFFLALASLFYFPVVMLFPLVWISVFVLQKNDNWRLLVIPVLGFGIPWLFMWVFFYLNDSALKLGKELITMLWTDHNAYLLEPYFLLLTAVITLLTILGSLSIFSFYQRVKVSSRKYFVICYWMLGMVIVSALGLITIGIEIVALSTIPVTFIITHYLFSEPKSIWKEILVWIFLGIMILVLFVY